MPSTLLVIIHAEHPVFGPLLTPYLANKNPDGTIDLMEQAFHASRKVLAQMNKVELQAIDIASHYTEKYLMW